MKIHDLAGFSKPLTRLIEVVSKGVGAVCAPYLIKRTAEARAHEIKVIANALKDVREQDQLPVVYDGGEIEVWQKPADNTLILDNTSVDQRVAGRLDYQERKRQNNIEKVTTVAATELLSETTVPTEPPDDDWITRFFSYSQDVSSQQMQELWGRILAGEVKKPGSYSLRTLDFVKNITKSDAQILETVGKLALRIPGGMAIIAIQDKDWLQKNRGIYPMHQFLLGELGVMYPSDLAFRAFNDSNIGEVALFGDDYLLIIKRGEIKSEIQLPIWKFTGIGQELLPLIQKPLDMEYLESIGKFFLTRKGKPEIGKITDRLPDGRVNYQIVKKIEVEQPKPKVATPSPLSPE
jgi:hypothetical protein